MENDRKVRPLLRFGPFEADLGTGELRKSGHKIRLQEQPFLVLAALLEQPAQVVSREELRKKLWPTDTFVEFDTGLNKAILKIREALEDSADTPRYIETLPRRGYRFIAPVGQVGISTATPAESRPRAEIHSLAVLPLDDLSGDPAQEYFADGMTEELITQIAKVSGLRVISRTSVMQYKGTQKPLPVIAAELNVDAVVEGAVMRSGQKVRISAQLIQARDDRHLWANSYERDLGDVLTLQGEVAQAIVNQIQVKLTPQAQSSLARTRRVNPQAYEAYLHGTFYWEKLTEDGLNKSIEYFNKAIELDPEYPDGYSGVARSYYALGILGFRSSGETFPKVNEAASKALQLDDLNAHSYHALAQVKKAYDRDWVGAEPYYKRAIELNPSDSVAYAGYSDHLSRLGRHTEAIATAEKGREADPLSARATAFLGYILYQDRQYAQAIAQCQKAVELDPHNGIAHWFLGLAYVENHRFPEGVAELEKAVHVSRSGPVYEGALGYAYARAGDKAKALSVLDDLMARSKQRYIAPLEIAIVYTGLGDKESAFAWVEKAYCERVARLEHLTDPVFDLLRSDPRYADLLRRIGLTP